MLKAGTDVHFRDPAVTTDRVLYHAVVEGADENEAWTATFTQGSAGLAAEQDVLIYYEIKREFMQQPARIRSMEETEVGRVVVFEPTGDPVSAESRQHYRVSTITADIEAKLGDEDGCKVVDISSTGFAAVSSTRYTIGANVTVVIDFQGRHCEGTASVQSVRDKPGGRYRYGFLSITGSDGGSFQNDLNEVSLEVQRLQLRRLSGAG